MKDETELQQARTAFFEELAALRELVAEVEKLGAVAFPVDSPTVIGRESDGVIVESPTIRFRCSLAYGDATIITRPGWRGIKQLDGPKSLE